MNDPAVFQRFMKQCFQDYRDDFIVPHIDDFWVHSKDFNSHVEHLRLTLQRLQQHGVKIKAKKCQLFKKEIRYLGRIVAADGYRLDPKNIQSVTELVKQNPKRLGEVRRLVGIFGYLRKCIANFSKKASPLYQPLKKTYSKNSSKSSVTWKQQHQDSLDQFLLSLIEPPILGYPDYTLEFILNVDASAKWLGAVLLQYQENELKLIWHGSRTLTAAEKKYYSSKLQFLAVKWAVCNHFQD